MTTTHPKIIFLFMIEVVKYLGLGGQNILVLMVYINDEGGEEFLYITDPETHKVCKTTLDGRKVLEIDTPKEINSYVKKINLNQQKQP